MESVIYSQACWISEDLGDRVKAIFDSLLSASDFSVLGFSEHFYRPSGYTAVWLLGESHLAVHTFPENNNVYAELSSCTFEKAQVFWTSLVRWCTENSIICITFPSNIYKPHK